MAQIEVALCPNCGSECVSWQPSVAQCYRCNWRGAPYDLDTGERDEDDTMIEGRDEYEKFEEII